MLRKKQKNIARLEENVKNYKNSVDSAVWSYYFNWEGYF